MSFKQGEKIVCVDASPSKLTYVNYTGNNLILNEIYTVRSVNNELMGVNLEEVVCGYYTCSGKYMGCETPWLSKRFRKLDWNFGEDVIKNLIEEQLTIEV